MSKIMTWYVWMVTYLCRNVTIVRGASYHLLGSRISWDLKIRFWLQVESYISDWQFSKSQYLASYVSHHNAMAYERLATFTKLCFPPVCHGLWHGGGIAEFGQRTKCAGWQYIIYRCWLPQIASAPPMFWLPFFAAAEKTEQQDDANNSIGGTYCIGTATDGPYVAAGIVTCNHIVIDNGPYTYWWNYM